MKIHSTYLFDENFKTWKILIQFSVVFILVIYIWNKKCVEKMSDYCNYLQKFASFNWSKNATIFPINFELFLVTNVRITSSAFRQVILRPTIYNVATHSYTRLEMRVDPWTILQLHHASKRKIIMFCFLVCFKLVYWK